MSQKKMFIVKFQTLIKQNFNKTLCNELVLDLPKRWEKHGDLIVLPCDCFLAEFWKDLPQEKFWECVAEGLHAKRIAKQGRISRNGYRSPQVSMLLGEDGWVTHVDNKIKYNFEVTKCMFASGNITEKIRMAKLNCAGEVVVDLFAGIGYFTLPLLVHAKAEFVHACEWNPDAVDALTRNIHDNKVHLKCKIYFGDNRTVCPHGVANRVILGLIPTAQVSYATACKALKPTGGILHIHCNVESKSNVCCNINEGFKFDKQVNYEKLTCNKKLKTAWFRWAVSTALEILSIFNQFELTHLKRKNFRAWQANMLHIERVKSYAPHIDHIVLDLQII